MSNSFQSESIHLKVENSVNREKEKSSQASVKVKQ